MQAMIFKKMRPVRKPIFACFERGAGRYRTFEICHSSPRFLRAIVYLRPGEVDCPARISPVTRADLPVTSGSACNWRRDVSVAEVPNVLPHASNVPGGAAGQTDFNASASPALTACRN